MAWALPAAPNTATRVAAKNRIRLMMPTFPKIPTAHRKSAALWWVKQGETELLNFPLRKTKFY